MSKESFIKKYGLEGIGKPVVISKETREAVEVLTRQSERLIQAGVDYAKNEKRRFGGSENV